MNISGYFNIGISSRRFGLSDLFSPGQHSAFQVFGIGKPHHIEHQAGLTAPVAASAIAYQLFVFQALQLIRLHLLDPAQRNQETADIELRVLIGLPDIYQVQQFSFTESFM
jgi:hypothetical protein